jgi:hypothetical protein
MRRASAMSIGFSSGAAQGSSISQSRYVRIIEYSPAPSGMRSRRFSSFRACFSTSSGIFASVMALSSSAISAAPSSPFAQLLLDRAHLLAQQVLALQVVERTTRALGDVARDLEHFDPMREQLEQRVHARLQIECLEQRLLLLRADVHQAGDEVGKPRGTLDRLQRRGDLVRDLRKQAQDLGSALLERLRASLDVGFRLRRLGMSCTRATRNG